MCSSIGRPTAQRLKALLLARENWGLIPGPEKSDTVSPTARHCYDVSLVL